jgi:hypothetical protein
MSRFNSVFKTNILETDQISETFVFNSTSTRSIAGEDIAFIRRGNFKTSYNFLYRCLCQYE